MLCTFWFSLPELPVWCCKNGFQTLWVSQCFSYRRALLVQSGWWNPRSLLQDWASQLSTIQVLTPSSSFTSSQAREQQDFWRATLIHSLWTPHEGLCCCHNSLTCWRIWFLWLLGSWKSCYAAPQIRRAHLPLICCFLTHFSAHFQESCGNLWSSFFGKHLTLCY